MYTKRDNEMSEMYSLVKRVERIEAILQLEYGTLDVGELTRRKEESRKFYADMSQQAKKLNARLKEQNKVLEAQIEEERKRREEDRAKMDALKEKLGITKEAKP